MSEEHSESSDAGLAAAFETATKDNYLGNPVCIDSLLRVMTRSSTIRRPTNGWPSWSERRRKSCSE
jgi:hypothetical protein